MKYTKENIYLKISPAKSAGEDAVIIIETNGVQQWIGQLPLRTPLNDREQVMALKSRLKQFAESRGLLPSPPKANIQLTPIKGGVLIKNTGSAAAFQLCVNCDSEFSPFINPQPNSIGNSPLLPGGVIQLKTVIYDELDDQINLTVSWQEECELVHGDGYTPCDFFIEHRVIQIL